VGNVTALRLAPDDLHLTLRFLGDLGVHQAAACVAWLQEAVAGWQPLGANYAGFEAWPASRPQVGVALFDVPARLQALQQALECWCRGIGLAPESRPFRAHVTLFRGRLPAPLVLPERAVEPLAVTRFSLMYRTRAEAGTTHRYERYATVACDHGRIDGRPRSGPVNGQATDRELT